MEKSRLNGGFVHLDRTSYTYLSRACIFGIEMGKMVVCWNWQNHRFQPVHHEGIRQQCLSLIPCVLAGEENCQ